ncbi:sulfotransferase 1C4 [Lucilia sericata]|uniref:sulfotransferase 1C4 n=1 Tax=Lucilia sericata TaxID=13632 RepID=UPI0018A7F0DC|nr:sulfotransferase 1C4 [Lucilia sericata]
MNFTYAVNIVFIYLVHSTVANRMAALKTKLKFPYEISLVDEKTNEELLKYFHGEKDGFVQVGPEKYFFPLKYKQEAESYYNFQARPNDIWVVTFPRSGTTWTQELVWLLANNLDFETAKSLPLTQRFPFFEFHLFMHPVIKEELLKENAHSKENQEFIETISVPGYKLFSDMPNTQRRFIKSHFPFSLLPPSIKEQKSKIIYVARRPKDVAVSFYHLNRLFRTQGYVGDFERYWGYFERSLNPWMPYYSHLKEAQQHKNDSNVLYLQYEDMVANLEDSIKKIANFLECPLAESKMPLLLDHLNITNFRNNPAVNSQELSAVGVLNKSQDGFVRKGVVGGSENEFRKVPGLLEKAEKWIAENENKLLQ